MNETSVVYHVLLQRGAPSDWQPVAAIATDCAPKIAKALVVKACRFGHGLIRLMLTHDEAQAMAGKLNGAGISAIAMPQADLVQPPQPFTLLRVELSDVALMIQVGTSTVFQPLPWETIRVLHVGCAKLKTKAAPRSLSGDVENVKAGVEIGLTALAVATGGGGMLAIGSLIANDAENAAKNSVGESGPAETEVLLEIFTLAPLMRLRIRQSKFSYDFLGERRQPTARANFALVLAELKARAKNAVATGLFPFAMGGRRIEPEKFGMDEGDYENQVSALLTIESKLGLPRG